MTSLIRLAPPQKEPLTLAEAKAHLRIEHDAEDATLAGYLAAARTSAEIYLRRALIDQRWQMTLDAWPAGPVRLPKPPLRSVEAVRVIDGTGTAATVPAQDYRVETRAEPGFVIAAPQAVLPAPGRAQDGIEIDFTAGFGAGWNAVPAPIRQALLMLVAQMYENRSMAAGSIAGTARSLLDPYRMISL